jgi:hypothetical protein
MQAKIKEQQKKKQANKQSLVQPDKVVSSGVAICRGARDGGGSCRAS